MRRILSIIAVCVALLALVSPSFATGVCAAQGGLAIAAAATDDGPAQLPNPCEMQGGKRVMPAQPEVRHVAVEMPRATEAQWRFGLTNRAMREGRAPAMELPPPRLG